MADRLEKTQQLVSAYESGSKAIPVQELPVLAEVLGVPINYFFGVATIDEEMEADLMYLHPTLKDVAQQSLAHYKVMQDQAYNLATNFQHEGGLIMLIDPTTRIDFKMLRYVMEDCEKQKNLRGRVLIHVDPIDSLEPMKIFHCEQQ